MEHQFPEIYVVHKQADIQREIEHNRLVNEAKKANSSSHERKARANPFHVNPIKKLVQVMVSFLNMF